MRIAVIGGGSWGTALASHLAGLGHETALLVRKKAVADDINDNNRNSLYLSDLLLHPALRATTGPEDVLPGAEVCLLAVPCQHMRATLEGLAPSIPAGAIPVCASKGIELSSLKRMSEVVGEILPQQAGGYAILSGPSFAKEVVQGKPVAVVMGCAVATFGTLLRDVFSGPNFRVYSSTDVIGVEIGGAMKNVIAIASGLSDGLGLGDNARAALITRGLAEMSRLGEALGGRASTFMGLSGMGDLVLTCAGELSRNRQVGKRLAAGENMRQITASMFQVAEGVKTTEAACLLADSLGIDLPVARAMRRVIAEEASPSDLVYELMTRSLREE